MTGHIRKRGDAWELRVYVGVDAVTGKKRYATGSIRGGKRDGERALVELAADAQRGKLSSTNTAVAELLDAWFDQAPQDFSPKTVVETRGFIDLNLRPALGTVPLTRLKSDPGCPRNHRRPTTRHHDHRSDRRREDDDTPSRRPISRVRGTRRDGVVSVGRRSAGRHRRDRHGGAHDRVVADRPSRPPVRWGGDR